MKVFDHRRVRGLRCARDYSLEMMARLMRVRCKRKITRSAISHWERGASTPSLESLVALSELFGVPMDYFFTDESNKQFDWERPGPDRFPDRRSLPEPSLPATGAEEVR